MNTLCFEPAAVVDTYCASPWCAGEDGDGWGDCDTRDLPTGEHQYRCHTCGHVWIEDDYHNILTPKPAPRNQAEMEAQVCLMHMDYPVEYLDIATVDGEGRERGPVKELTAHDYAFRVHTYDAARGHLPVAQYIPVLRYSKEADDVLRDCPRIMELRSKDCAWPACSCDQCPYGEECGYPRCPGCGMGPL